MRRLQHGDWNVCLHLLHGVPKHAGQRCRLPSNVLRCPTVQGAAGCNAQESARKSIRGNNHSNQPIRESVDSTDFHTRIFQYSARFGVHALSRLQDMCFRLVWQGCGDLRQILYRIESRAKLLPLCKEKQETTKTDNRECRLHSL